MKSIENFKNTRLIKLRKYKAIKGHGVTICTPLMVAIQCKVLM